MAYAASKGAVMAMTKAMALDHAAENIRVNCIAPGIVATEMVEKFNTDPSARRQREAMHPMGGFGQPEDVASAAVFLASDESRWTTGTVDDHRRRLQRAVIHQALISGNLSKQQS